MLGSIRQNYMSTSLDSPKLVPDYSDIRGNINSFPTRLVSQNSIKINQSDINTQLLQNGSVPNWPT